MQLLDTPVLLTHAEPSVVLGHDQNQGTEVSVCPERPSWKQLMWMETPGWGQPYQRWRHKMGNGRVWDGAGLEMVAVLPMGPGQGIQHLLRAGPAAHLDPPCATTGTEADEVTSLAQSQCGEQGLARDRATWASWEARGELGAARVALAWQWEGQNWEWGKLPVYGKEASQSPLRGVHQPSSL